MLFEVGKLYVIYANIENEIKKDPDLFKSFVENKRLLLASFNESRFVLNMKIIPFLYLEKDTKTLEYFYDGIPFTVMEYDNTEKKVLVLQTDDGDSKIGYIKILSDSSKERSCSLYKLT